VRAAIYYHFAKFVFVQDPQQMRAAHMKAVECYRDALPMMRPPGERVAIPFEGKTLYGVLRGKGAVVVMAPGWTPQKKSCMPMRIPSSTAGWRRWRSTARAGRSRVRDPDLRRLRARGARGGRLDREAQGSRF